MSQSENTGCLPITLAAAAIQYQRIDFDGTIAVANEIGIGTALFAGAIGDSVTVATHSKPGTYIAIAAGAIAKGAPVYSAAAGKVSATQASGAFRLGFAARAASANNTLVEVIPAVGDTAGS